MVIKTFKLSTLAYSDEIMWQSREAPDGARQFRSRGE